MCPRTSPPPTHPHPSCLTHLASPHRQPLHTTAMASDKIVELQPGDLFARQYTIKRLLGRGAFGSVYHAIHIVNHHNYALKMEKTNAQPAVRAVDDCHDVPAPDLPPL